MVRRREFKSAFQLTADVLEFMGEEFEMVRSDKTLDKQLRSALMEVMSAHLQNMSAVSAMFQASIYNPIDPDNTGNRNLN